MYNCCLTLDLCINRTSQQTYIKYNIPWSYENQTWAISSDVLIIRARLFKFVTTASTAILIPRLRSIAFIPAATDLHPSEYIARVRIVAQVVPVDM